MTIYRKGDGQFSDGKLGNRGKEQEKSHIMSDADKGGYTVGRYYPPTTVEELQERHSLIGEETPVSAKGMYMGFKAKWRNKK